MTIYKDFLTNIRGYDFYIYAKKIDYVKIKINNDLFDYFFSNSTKIYNSFSWSTENILDFYGLKLFDKFYIVNFGQIGNSKHRFDIVDYDKNKIGNIIFALQDYKSNISYIEFSGLFCKEYFDFIYDFFDFFSVDIKINGILKKIDYHLDIAGLECYQVIDMLKQEKNYKGLNVLGLNAFDKKKILDKKGIVNHGKIITGLTIPGTYNKFIIYDKILDILENYPYRKINGVNPYDDYLSSDIPITRLELSKKGEGLLHIKNNSIGYIFDNIESLFFDYLKTLFHFDFSKLSFIPINSLNGKKIYFAKEKKNIKLIHSINMFKAYGNNLLFLLGKKEFEKIALNIFPNLQNKDLLDYLDIFELSEIFTNNN